MAVGFTPLQASLRIVSWREGRPGGDPKLPQRMGGGGSLVISTDTYVAQCACSHTDQHSSVGDGKNSSVSLLISKKLPLKATTEDLSQIRHIDIPLHHFCPSKAVKYKCKK